MAAEEPGGSELAQLVPDHVFTDVNRNELVAVVHGQRVPDELRRNGGPPSPGLEHPLIVLLVQERDAPEQLLVDVRTLFDRSRHALTFGLAARPSRGPS